MTAGQQQNLMTSRPAAGVRAPSNDWVVAALVLVLALVAGLCDGGFWPGEAALVAAVSLVLIGAALVVTPLDRRSSVLVASLCLLASWWLARAITGSSVTAFLPLGASILAFAAAFVAVRPLSGRPRQLAGLGAVGLGAAMALVGFAGLVWRWSPMAIPAQGLWRLSSTLTYSDAAGLVLGVCLLVALGCDRSPTFVRVAVCLMGGGLIASQSRGAYLAFGCACVLVPWQRFVRFRVPLLAGLGLGIVAVASSTRSGSVLWLAAVLMVAIALAVWDGRKWFETLTRRPVAVSLVAGVIVAVTLVHHEIGLRLLAPSDQDRSVEWSTALRQWASAPLVGVGPDQLLRFHAADGTFAHFAHNEYLQVGADAGVAGIGLLAFVVGSLAKVVHRFDVLSSCAVAALVCVAVGGAFDFDWHLPVVGLLAGWCAGLAVRMES